MRAPIKVAWILGTAVVSTLLIVTSAAWAQTDPAQVAKGQRTYEERKCAACHVIKGKGGKAGPLARGPDLSTVGATREAQWLKTFMRDPKVMVPKAKMMPFKGSGDELEALVAYLASLK